MSAYHRASRVARAGEPSASAPYKEALAEAERVGASRAVGDAELAQACLSLSRAHAVNPEMLYNGAKANGLSGTELARLAHDDPGAFAFVPFDTEGELIRRPSAKDIIGLHERWLDEDMDAVTRVAEELDCHGGEPAAEAVPEALDGATVYRGFGVGEGEDWRKGFRHGGTPGGVSHSLARSTALAFARGTGYMQGGASGPVPVVVRTVVRAADVNGGETSVRWSGDPDTDPRELARMLWEGDTAYGEFEVVLKKLPAPRYELEWTSAERDPAGPGAPHRTRRSPRTSAQL